MIELITYNATDMRLNDDYIYYYQHWGRKEKQTLIHLKTKAILLQNRKKRWVLYVEALLIQIIIVAELLPI